MGDYESAFALVKDIENNSSIRNNRHHLGYTLARLSILHQIGKTQDCETIARQAIELGETHKLTMTSGFAHSALGAWLLNEGRLDESMESFEAGLPYFEQSNTGVFIAYYKCHYAHCLAKSGRVSQATDEIESAYSMIKNGFDGWAYADAFRMIVDFEYHYLNRKARCIARLESAYHAASAKGALLWTLRLSRSLARMYSQVGEHDRARGILENELKHPALKDCKMKDYQESIELYDSLINAK